MLRNGTRIGWCDRSAPQLACFVMWIGNVGVEFYPIVLLSNPRWIVSQIVYIVRMLLWKWLLLPWVNGISYQVFKEKHNTGPWLIGWMPTLEPIGAPWQQHDSLLIWKVNVFPIKTLLSIRTSRPTHNNLVGCNILQLYPVHFKTKTPIKMEILPLLWANCWP